MNIVEFSTYDGLGLAELVKSKQVTPEELVQLSVKAIKELNPDLNAVVSILEEEAISEIEEGLPEGPFQGVPFVIKELVLHAKNIPFSAGSRLAEGSVLPVDSELMKRFRKAGFVTVGTTTTPEFGYNAATEAVLYGPTRNPWNVNHSPGGSSGGSAAAIASGMVPVGHANDGGGSIRIPASCSGLVGLKPTRGRIPAGPYNSEPLNGIAIEFALTKTVRDTAYLLDAVSGPDIGCYGWPESPSEEYKKIIERPVKPLKIAWTGRPASGVPVDEECLMALHETVQLCEDLGHIVVEDRPEYEVEPFSLATLQIWTANIYKMINGVAKASGKTPSDKNIESAIWQCYLYGKEMKASELLDAIEINATVSRQVGQFFSDYDVLLSPTMAALPAKIGFLNANNPSIDAKQWTEQIFTYAPFTNLFNATGQPSISLPLKWSAAGLPIGMQFTGRFADEATLLQLATQLEKAHQWKDKKPAIHASKLAKPTI
ncbi:amidase [Aneurinibacillus soli]|uniref:6-aminohexanoate-cyclic-dimer hydrolase n=1 Tax=Aneurinibacillus soli TaxID=1500254 RepID=A0A0U5BA19_9BACL|nr:amidase family protein [Aneurinibacillus soli]PYE61399.1 amidase [Aneurinibacillus soli]BAU27772.1 6-aminohexanoate-cyclic-dimer hydrolase [Aneurinibacillus soli]